MPLFSVAQDPYHLVIDKSRGLPSNSVYDILQDSHGFIWVATSEGLCRYDGHTFVSYTSNEQTSRSGSAIIEDRLGRIWYENFDGYLYYVQNDSLHALKQRRSPGYQYPAIMGNYLMTLGMEGIDVYSIQTLQYVRSIPIPINMLLHCRQQNNHYYVFSDSLYLIDENLQVKTIAYGLPATSRDFPAMPVACGGKILMLSRDNITGTVYELINDQIRKAFQVPPNDFVQNVSVADDYIWLLTTRGAYSFNAKGELRNNGKPYFEKHNVSALMSDREGNHWIGTVNKGILFVPDMNNRLMNFPGFYPVKCTVLGDNLYIGTQQEEIARFSLTGNQLHYLYKGKKQQDVSFIQADSLRKVVLYAMQDAGELDGVTQTLKPVPVFVKELLILDDAFYAYATTGAMGLILRDEKKAPRSPWYPLFMQYKLSDMEPVNAYVYSGVRGKTVAFNPANGFIYFAGNAGLMAVNTTGRKELLWQGQKLYILKLLEHHGKVWALNSLGRLFVIEKNNQVSPVDFTINKEPLVIKKIKITGDYLFLFTHQRLYAVSLLQQPYQPVELLANLQAGEMTDVELWKNQLVFTCPSGLMITSFEEAKENVRKPLLHLHGIQCRDQRYAPGIVPEVKYTDNDIEIPYSILSFATLGNYPLYYSINNQDWTLAPVASRVLKLAALAPGEYTIQFRLGNQGDFPQQQVHFIIRKPYWQTGWFIGLCMLTVATFTFVVYRWRTSQLKKQNALLIEKMALEKNLNQSMLTSIKSQMNPHFFYNALNTIQSFIYSDDKKNASAYLTRFSKLTRTILEMSEQEQVSLAEEIKALTLYLEIEQARFSGDFSFVIHVSPNIDQEWVHIPSMIVQPYVENAIKHGLLHKEGEKKLVVSFEQDENTLHITIDDNGIGRKKSMELNAIKQTKHKSFAMQANAKRIEILNQGNRTIGFSCIDKVDAAGFAAGTTVKISLSLLNTR